MRMNRRTFLFTTAGAAVATACGSNGGSGGELSEVTTVFQRFSNEVLVPGSLRLPVSLAGEDGKLIDGPAELRGRIVDTEGRTVVDEIVAPRHRVSDDTPAYWPFRVQLDSPGLYALQVPGADAAAAAFQLRDPADVEVPKIGEVLPPFDTPTVADPRGVQPICSRLGGPCALHEVTLTEALATGKPVLYVIGTPAHCATAVCGPGLEHVLAARERLGDAVTMVHADVYADEAGTVTAPAVSEYKLSYEPVIFLADTTGTIVDRIDIVWDRSEIDAALDALVS